METEHNTKESGSALGRFTPARVSEHETCSQAAPVCSRGALTPEPPHLLCQAYNLGANL